jgi:hypothetical protein
MSKTPPVVFTEHLHRCQFCGREMRRVSALSYAQNPYCSKCLEERVQRTSAKTRLKSWKRSGDYFEAVTLDPRRPQ